MGIAIVFVVLLGIRRIGLVIMIYKYSTSVSTNFGWNKPFLPMQYATQSNVIHLIKPSPYLSEGEYFRSMLIYRIFSVNWIKTLFQMNPSRPNVWLSLITKPIT